MWISASANAGDVLIVRGGKSCPDAAERRFADKTASLVGGWLDAAGVRTRLVDEDALSYAALSTAGAVVLPYNPHPPREHVAWYRAIAGKGKRLLVFYSSDAELAAAMGFRLGKYESVPVSGRWSEVRFRDTAPPNLPDGFMQRSRSLRPVHPVRRDAAVIADWVSDSGRLSGAPAIAESASGFWMTHILLDDGDREAKTAMLLGLLSRCDSSVLRSAAQKAVSELPGLAGKGNFQAVSSMLIRESAASGTTRAVSAGLTRAATVMAERDRAWNEARFGDVLARQRELGRLLQDAYGLACSGVRPEIRGVWDQTGLGLYPGDWDRTCRELAALGVTDLFVNLLGGGWARYDSRVLPASAVVREAGSQLVPCVKAAAKRGMRVHVWKYCWNMEGATDHFVGKMRAAGRLQQSASGREVAWLNPALPENVALEAESLVEAVRMAPVAGVHLDYIRYPESGSSRSEADRALFEKWLGAPVPGWPAAVAGGQMAVTYRKWRAGNISDAVAAISSAVRRASPGVKVSAAVFGKYPSCVDSVGQDWPLWVGRGDVDFVCPMNYAQDINAFRDLVLAQVRLPGCEGRILPGIGVTANESRLGAVDVVDQVRIVRQIGLPGYVFFDLDNVLAREVLPVLSAGGASR